MVVDTSALAAILFDEPDAEQFEAAIESDPVRLISAATLVEASLVVDKRFGEVGRNELDALLLEAGFEVVAFSQEQANIAREALRTYGKGSHPAALNLGDCFAYALAQTSGEPLLFKGQDFPRTDVRAVTVGR
jgi:ribonuclease VapC